MWSWVLSVPLFVAPVEDALPDLGTEAELELVSIVGTTHLSLWNPTGEPALVRLSRGGEALLHVPLAPFAERAFEFPRHTLAGTTVSVAVETTAGRVHSGEYAVDALVEAGYRSLWFESAPRLDELGEPRAGVSPAVHAWGELPSGPAFVVPLGTATTGLAAPPAPSPHVPVITPRRRKGDLPPRIEPAPLPPV